VNLMSHPGNKSDNALVCSAAFQSFKIEYFGKAVHTAASPWEGVSIWLLGSMKLCSYLVLDKCSGCYGNWIYLNICTSSTDQASRCNPRSDISWRSSTEYHPCICGWKLVRSFGHQSSFEIIY
jgi:hypothetical protein